jgi:hypothetical protein
MLVWEFYLIERKRYFPPDGYIYCENCEMEAVGGAKSPPNSCEVCRFLGTKMNHWSDPKPVLPWERKTEDREKEEKHA